MPTLKKKRHPIMDDVPPHRQQHEEAIRCLKAAIFAFPDETPRRKMARFVEVALKVAYYHSSRDESWTAGQVLDSGMLAFSNTLDENEFEAGRPALGAYQQAVATGEPFECILGHVYAVIVGAGETNSCQHFTPWNMATGAARLFPNGVSLDAAHNTIGDICCGAGTLVLAKLNKLVRSHPGEQDVLLGWKIWANDKDPLCSAMTALQLLFNQFLFGLPIGMVVIEKKDIITEYMEERPAYMSVAGHARRSPPSLCRATDSLLAFPCF